MKGSLLFILGAGLGIIGYIMADSPLDPFHAQIEAKECQSYYAKQLNITEEEFVNRLQHMQATPNH
jgi:hypothetical protein